MWNWVRTQYLISAFSFSGTRPKGPVPKCSKNQNWMEMFFKIQVQIQLKGIGFFNLLSGDQETKTGMCNDMIAQVGVLDLETQT